MKNETSVPAAPHMPASQDSAQVLVFPPFLLVGTLVLGLSLGAIWPWSLFSPTTPTFWVHLAAALAIPAGALLMIWGRRTMVRAGTNVPPQKPTLNIVTNGPFRFTRNPLYLGGSVIYLAISLGLSSAWLLSLFIPMMLTLQWGIIEREERYLEAKFGQTYLAYKSQVRRWF